MLSFLSTEYLDLTKSNSESRRFVRSKAIKLNELVITDEKYILNLSDFNKDGDLIVSFGKKKRIIVRIKK